MKQITRLSQNDYRWNRKKIGNTNLTIGSHGCLITCIAMACGKTPYEIERTLQFTDNAHEYGGGLLLWDVNVNEGNFEKLGLKFETRQRSFTTDQANLVQEMCGTDNLFPILEVQTKNNGRHWVLPVGRALTWRGYGWATNDPWDGSRQWKTVGVGAPYQRVLGFVLFSKIKEESQEI